MRRGVRHHAGDPQPAGGERVQPLLRRRPGAGDTVEVDGPKPRHVPPPGFILVLVLNIHGVIDFRKHENGFVMLNIFCLFCVVCVVSIPEYGEALQLRVSGVDDDGETVPEMATPL